MQNLCIICTYTCTASSYYFNCTLEVKTASTRKTKKINVQSEGYRRHDVKFLTEGTWNITHPYSIVWSSKHASCIIMRFTGSLKHRLNGAGLQPTGASGGARLIGGVRTVLHYPTGCTGSLKHRPNGAGLKPTGAPVGVWYGRPARIGG